MIIERMKILRNRRGISQETVGNAIGITQRTYSYYEKGERTVPPEILVQLADFYKVSVDYLLGLTDERKPYSRAKR